MTTANELYSLAKKINKEADVRTIGVHHLNQTERFKEITIGDLYGLSEAELQCLNERVVFRIIRNVSVDYERNWLLGAVWFDNLPVMIVQNAGRGGQDHEATYITWLNQYNSMIQFIISVINNNKESMVNKIVINDREDLPFLDTFYGRSLNDEGQDFN